MMSGSRSGLWRFGAILLFVGLPLGMLALVVSNLIETSQARDEMARQQETWTHIIAQVARHKAPALTAQDTASLYLDSASGTLARAEIQDRAGKLVRRLRGTLAETQNVGTPELEANGTVAVQLTLTIDNSGLRDLLYETESGLPLLDITDLSIDSQDGGQNDNPMVGAGDRALHVQMTVRGHWRKARA